MYHWKQLLLVARTESNILSRRSTYDRSLKSLIPWTVSLKRTAFLLGIWFASRRQHLLGRFHEKLVFGFSVLPTTSRLVLLEIGSRLRSWERLRSRVSSVSVRQEKFLALYPGLWWFTIKRWSSAYTVLENQCRFLQLKCGKCRRDWPPCTPDCLNRVSTGNLLAMFLVEHRCRRRLHRSESGILRTLHLRIWCVGSDTSFWIIWVFCSFET